MACLGFTRVLEVMTLPRQYLVVFLVLLPLYTHKRVSSMNLIFYGIFGCFFAMVVFLMARSLYLIAFKGPRGGIRDNLLPRSTGAALAEFPTFANIMFFQDAAISMFANA